MEVHESVEMEGFEFIAVKEEPAEDIEAVESVALEAPGQKERALNSIWLLQQSASGDHTTTPRETPINPHEFDSLQPSPYTCKLCGDVFPNAMNLSKHYLNNRKKSCTSTGMQTLENLAVEWWFCEICQKQFKSKDFRTAHMLGHATEIEKTAASGKEHTGTKQCIYSCDICSKPFSQQSSLVLHRCQHAQPCSYSCEVCGKSFTEAAKLARHVYTHTRVHPYKCSECGKSFRQLFHMKRHILTHTGDQPFICSICGKSYNRSDNLECHKRIHTGELPYCCEFCGKCFKVSSNLKRHKRLHTGEKPYSCDICGRTFTQSDCMKEHRKTHTKKKVYACDDCGRTFTESHALTVVRRNGKRKKSCEACRKQSGKFRRHRHAGVIGPLPTFDCEDCGKSFDRLSGLERHKRMHTGERPFSCDHCGRSFTQARGLKSHICTNTEGPPYACQVCGKCFEIFSSLNKHKAKKHKM